MKDGQALGGFILLMLAVMLVSVGQSLAYITSLGLYCLAVFGFLVMMSLSEERR